MSKTARIDSTLKWGFRLVGLVVLGLIVLVLITFAIAFIAGALS